MRSLTSFTPYFAEDVTYALEELHGELNDNVDLLHLLQSIFPDEYANFTERMGVLGLSASREESSKFDEFELGRWASDRGQLLSRTVRGPVDASEAAWPRPPLNPLTPPPLTSPPVHLPGAWSDEVRRRTARAGAARGGASPPHRPHPSFRPSNCDSDPSLGPHPQPQP